MNIEHMADQVRDYGRTRTSLWQGILVASNLREECRDLRAQRIVPIFNEKPANTPKVNTPEEVLEIDVEDKSPIAMLSGVRHDGTLSLESMGDSVFSTFRLVNFFYAIRKTAG